MLGSMLVSYGLYLYEYYKGHKCLEEVNIASKK